MRIASNNVFAQSALALVLGVTVPAVAQQPRTLKMQSSWPASLTLQDNFRYFAERVDKLTGGQLRIEALAAGQVVPGLEVLDATSKKTIDGAHSVSSHWTGRNKAAALFAGTPAPFGMDTMDFVGWMYEGGGLDLWWALYQKELKLNVVAFPILPSGPQAFGWFARPIRNLRDFKSMKCWQTGIAAEIFRKMGVQTVDLPGAVDCAESVGGIEDLRLGLPQVYKYYYVQGLHGASVVGELLINADVWNSLPAQQREAIRSAASETLLRWSVRWQMQNADALDEMRAKHGTVVLLTPREILTAFLQAWDAVANEESAKNPFFAKVLESQRAYASKVVPAKRLQWPPYSFAANYYWPESAAAPARPAVRSR
jgi:TRAP-type mannitol/chloroaromatic compound transport system substrate-binding protein